MTEDQAPVSTRANPFHLGLPDGRWMTERVQAIAAEAQARGTQLEDPGGFLLLAQVGASLMDLRPDGAGTEPGAIPEPAIRQQLFHSFGMFFFQAFHLLRPDASQDAARSGGGQPGAVLLAVDAATLPALVDPAFEHDVSGWHLPAPAGYLLLPANRFWTRPHGEDVAAEAVDGIGWVFRPGEPDALSLVAVTGVIPGRPGFSVLSVPLVPLADAPGWTHAEARSASMGQDFAPNLPGAELGGLFGIETAGELLKLLARSVALVGAGRLEARAFPPIPAASGAPDAP
jgi:hypothetical protein